MEVNFVSEDELNRCASIVEDELLALDAIYPDFITRASDKSKSGLLIKMELPIALCQPTEFRILDDGTTHGAYSVPYDESNRSYKHVIASPETLMLSYLPPLILDLHLPITYPLHDPPNILSTYVTSSWISLDLFPRLHAKFHELWAAQRALGEGVLWRIAELVVNGDFLEDPLHVFEGSTVNIGHPAPRILTSQLLAYDETMNAASFASTTFFCHVCLEEKKGSACMQLSCGHVFCKECLRDGWGLAVREGDCDQVRCPHQDCMATLAAQRREEKLASKIDAGDANEEDVRRVLSEDEVKRWQWLRNKRAIERDPSTVHCPLQFCQAAVPRPPSLSKADEEEESGSYASSWDKLRTCGSCGYSFCVFCKRTWHGPITPCNVRTTSTFILEYLSLPEDSSKRQLMERTLGRENMRRLVRQYEEDEKNRILIEESTTGCPECGVRCEKSFGCNHMTCTRCSTHYCYRCGERLPPKDPYTHFSNRMASCYNKLFDFEEDAAPDDDWIPMEQDLFDL